MTTKAPSKIFLASQGNSELYYTTTKSRMGILMISVTQDVLEAHYENTCNKIITQDPKKKIVFLNIGNLHYAVIAENDSASVAFLRRQLLLFHDLLRFRVKITLNAAPMNATLNLTETRRLIKVILFLFVHLFSRSAYGTNFEQTMQDTPKHLSARH